MDKLRMKFSALNVDFNGPSVDFLGSRKPAHESIKKRYPRKSRYFTVVAQSFMKTAADRHGHSLSQQGLPLRPPSRGGSVWVRCHPTSPASSVFRIWQRGAMASARSASL